MVVVIKYISAYIDKTAVGTLFHATKIAGLIKDQYTGEFVELRMA